MPSSRYANRYSNNERKKDYSEARRRAESQDALQVRNAMYESNARSNQREQQRQREQQLYNNKATRDEQRSMQSMNRENAKRNHEDYVNRGYNKEEQAFNKGRKEGVDKMNATRLKNQRALNDTLNKMDRYGQNMQNKMSKSVPSTRPGESGREWEDHKYIDKVTTKTGKVRYIYDLGPSSSDYRDSNQYKQNRKKGQAIYDKREQERLKNRSPQEVISDTLRDTKKGFDKGLNDTKKAFDKGLKDAGKAVSDGTKAVSDFLRNGLSNTPLSSLFEPKQDNRLTETKNRADKNRRPSTLG